MFSFFKKKNPIDQLESKYRILLKEAHQLSTINRSKSDAKIAEAELIAEEIEKLKH
ncbi:Lacal_2735 family protein [Wenyingzhuangia aestuarii]|uniref:Lacal_2735 family protein n=1 Tax=Wenyingzhuangia aestuarii TaxID=1647582 RepID=UPI00143A4D09|nr:Lacal_2735 family protein [Wenyingzhuangia aestuarii]NJB82236.1 hypothetical protein [Wenyingzhuangia aestuarii]